MLVPLDSTAQKARTVLSDALMMYTGGRFQPIGQNHCAEV
jgi:hypothetical protein